MLIASIFAIRDDIANDFILTPPIVKQKDKVYKRQQLVDKTSIISLRVKPGFKFNKSLSSLSIDILTGQKHSMLVFESKLNINKLEVED